MKIAFYTLVIAALLLFSSGSALAEYDQKPTYNLLERSWCQTGSFNCRIHHSLSDNKPRIMLDIQTKKLEDVNLRAMLEYNIDDNIMLSELALTKKFSGNNPKWIKLYLLYKISDLVGENFLPQQTGWEMGFKFYFPF